jgi:hypothetical protein
MRDRRPGLSRGGRLEGVARSSSGASKGACGGDGGSTARIVRGRGRVQEQRGAGHRQTRDELELGIESNNPQRLRRPPADDGYAAGERWHCSVSFLRETPRFSRLRRQRPH